MKAQEMVFFKKYLSIVKKEFCIGNDKTKKTKTYKPFELCKEKNVCSQKCKIFIMLAWIVFDTFNWFFLQISNYTSLMCFCTIYDLQSFTKLSNEKGIPSIYVIEHAPALGTTGMRFCYRLLYFSLLMSKIPNFLCPQHRHTFSLKMNPFFQIKDSFFFGIPGGSYGPNL